MLDASRAGSPCEGTCERGRVDAGGETVAYELCTIDARPAGQQEEDTRRGRPQGNIVVVVPGHGQSIRGPRKLLVSAAQLSRSKIAWCVDPVPARGGDRSEAQAIAHIVRDRIAATFPTTGEPIAATLIGWSHGGSEALRAAEHAPDLFPQYLGLCPTGLAERTPLRLLGRFALEAARILWSSLRHGDWTCLKDTLRLGGNLAVGLVRDAVRSRSPRRLLEDIRWAGSRVTSPPLNYSGEVVLLFGAQDTVIRWRDALPGCDSPQNIPTSLAEFRETNFPQAQRVEVHLVEGTHVSPEVDPPAFLEIGLGLLGQLDGRTLPGSEMGLGGTP